MLTDGKEIARIGLTAHTAVLHKLVSKGFEVLQPLGDHLRFDLAYYQEETAELIRIQCKAARYDANRGVIIFKNFSRAGGKGEKRKYTGEVEYFGVYCADLNSVMTLPTMPHLLQMEGFSLCAFNVNRPGYPKIRSI